MADNSPYTWIIYALVVIYALCYQLQRPIEPFLVDKLVKGGADEAVVAFGRVNAFFSVAQGVGSLVMGWILDRFSVRVGLVVNFVACALQYYLLSISDSLEMLYLSKVPGMMMGGFLCAQTAIATVTEEGPERVKALGRLTTAYTVGGVLGPYLGGYLGSSGDYYYGAKLATAGSLLACVMVLLLPAKTANKASNSASTSPTKEPEVAGGWTARAGYILALVGPLLSVKIATGIANNMARSAQPVVLKNDLGFGEAAMGQVMSAQFAFGGFANGFLLVPLTAFLGGDIHLVVKNCVLCMGAVYAAQAMVFSPTAALVERGSVLGGGLYVGAALFLSTFQFSLATGITAETQSLVPKGMVGSLMGIEHSAFAAAGMIGPLVGTYIFQATGLSGLCFFCACLFFGILAYWGKVAHKHKDQAKTA